MVRGHTAPVCPHLLIEAADGQELAAGAPGQRLDPQGPLVGTEAGEEPSIQGVEQHLVLFRGVTVTLSHEGHLEKGNGIPLVPNSNKYKLFLIIIKGKTL